MSALASIKTSGWRASPLSSQWKNKAYTAGPAREYPEGQIGTGDEHLNQGGQPFDPEAAAGVVAPVPTLPEQPAAPRTSPLSSQWGKGLLSSAADASVAAGSVVSGKPAATNGSAIQPVDGQTSPLAQKPATNQGGSPVAPQEAQAPKAYTNPSVSWTKGAPLPKTADGREFLTWGGDKNIGGKMYAIDPDAYTTVRGQLDQQRQAMMANPEYAKYWRATDKGEKTPDWVLDDMAKNLVASGITDIRQVGKGEYEAPVGSNGLAIRRSQEVFKKPDGTYVTRQTVTTGGGESMDTQEVETPLKPEDAAKVVERDGKFILPVMRTGIINKATGQPIISQYGGRTDAEKGIWGGTYQGSGNTGYGVTFDKDGLPVFFTSGASSKDGIFRELAKAGPILSLASLIPGMQWLAPVGRIASGTAALAYDNPLGAITSFAGAVPGVNAGLGLGMSADTLNAVKTVGQGAGLINSVKNKDLLGTVAGLGNMTNTLPGKLDIGGVNVNDLAAVNQLYKGVKYKNPFAIAQAGWRLTDGA